MGMIECMGHKWMSCAIDLFPKVDELIEHLAVRTNCFFYLLCLFCSAFTSKLVLIIFATLLFLQCLESKDNKGLTWSAVVKRCFPGEHATNMKTCYDTRSEDLLKKVNLPI